MSQGLEIVSRRKTVKRYEDRREAPRYTSAEVARYLRLPESTLRAWFFGQTNFRPFFVPADSGRGLLSFYNLVEAYALSWAKQRHDELRPARIRHALEYVRERLPQYKRPLVTKRFSTDGKFLFIQDLEDGEPRIDPDAATINASRWGQLLLPSMTEILELIEYDESDLARLVSPVHGRNVVVINPLLSSGRPVVRGTGVLASIIHQRAKKAGEPIERLATDYNLTSGQIQAAIDYIAAA